MFSPFLSAEILDIPRCEGVRSLQRSAHQGGARGGDVGPDSRRRRTTNTRGKSLERLKIFDIKECNNV